jgi:hypothetical protein
MDPLTSGSVSDSGGTTIIEAGVDRYGSLDSSAATFGRTANADADSPSLSPVVDVPSLCRRSL